ncbi:MAG: hypothetical protein IJX76_06145 [Clostridia bacterium]|nr:hypothetical protein [Clostridia bacterium]
MKTIHIYNPAAGSGIKDALPENHYITKSAGDCRRYIAECCKEDPYTHFVVHGGDGTINEAVAGVLAAGAGETARLTFVPAGSGNDTVRTLAAMEGEDFPLDAYLCNGRHGVNMVNIGFDCNVVSSASRFKKKHGIAGSLSYLLGIVTEFFKPFGWRFSVKATEADGDTFEFEGDTLLCAVCNGQWCGGGFHNSPLSDMRDGVMELLLVKKVSRLKFITLIGKYKKGTLIDPASGDVYEKYAHIVTYKRITSITVRGTKQVCIDGEVIEADSAEIEILPAALRYLADAVAVKETV